MNQYIDQIKSLQKALLDHIEDENDDNIEYENANAVERKPGQNENNTYSNDDKFYSNESIHRPDQESAKSSFKLYR